MKVTTELVRNFIVENFLFGNDEGLTNETSFLDDGIIDSTGVLELVTFLEETFKIQVDDEEMITDNLDSIVNVTQYVENKIKTIAAA